MKTDLVNGLSRTQKVSDSGNTRPILAFVLLEAKLDQLKLSATDLEIGLTTHQPAQIIEGGRIALPAKKLLEIVQKMPKEEVTLKTIDSSWVEIRSGRSVFKIMGLPADEFPVIPDVLDEEFVEFDPLLFKAMIERVLFAASRESFRYNLNGVLLANFNGNLRMVATDGHRLAMTDQFELPESLKLDTIVPRKGFEELKKILDKGDGLLQIAVRENEFVAKKDETIIIMRLMEGQFPDYNQVVPTDLPKSVVIDRSLLSDSMKRIGVLLDGRNKAVKFEISTQGLIISTRNPDLGEGRELVPIEFSGDPMEIGFNGKFFDVLSVLKSEKISLLLTDEISPAIVRPVGDLSYTYVIMPIRP